MSMFYDTVDGVKTTGGAVDSTDTTWWKELRAEFPYLEIGRAHV